VEVERIADGLWRWTARLHGRDVVCLYVESQHAISLLDPVVPPEDRERFLDALDRDVARHGGPVHVYGTSRGRLEHAVELVERYGALVVDGPSEDVVPLPGVEAFWVPSHRTLFVGGGVERVVRDVGP